MVIFSRKFTVHHKTTTNKGSLNNNFLSHPIFYSYKRIKSEFKILAAESKKGKLQILTQ